MAQFLADQPNNLANNPSVSQQSLIRDVLNRRSGKTELRGSFARLIGWCGLQRNIDDFEMESLYYFNNQL